MMRYWGRQAMLVSVIVLLTQALCAACGTTASPTIEPRADTDTWERHKGACEQVLTAPDSYPTDDIARCTRLWEIHRQVADLSLDVRSLYAIAFSQLWYHARDDYDRDIATTALARLCVPRHPLDDQGRVEEVVPATRHCGADAVSVDAVSADERAATLEHDVPFDAERKRLEALRATTSYEETAPSRAARRHLERGHAAIEKQRFGEAVVQFTDALDAHPSSIEARYHLAVALAWLGDDTRVLAELETLYALDTPRVIDPLRDARTELAFERLRDHLAFKVITGYRRVVVANGAGDFGLPHVKEIVERLEQRDVELHAVVNDKNLRTRPVIFYRAGLDEEARQLVRDLAMQHDTVLTTIEFESTGNPDFIVIWGQDEVVELADPDEPFIQGVPAHGGAQDPDRLLDEIDGTLHDVEQLRRTGDKASDVLPR